MKWDTDQNRATADQTWEQDGEERWSGGRGVDRERREGDTRGRVGHMHREDEDEVRGR
jgi:hypothetical protein